MKISLKLLNVGLFAFCSTTLSANTVYTDPVGYMTATIEADDSGNGRFSAVGFPLLNPVVVAGVVDSSTANSITDSSLTWAPSADDLLNDLNESIYYLTVKSGLSEGRRLGIISISGSTITVDSDQADVFASPSSTYEIRSVRTIGDIFGYESGSGVLPGTDGDLVYLASGGQFVSYYFLDEEIVPIPGGGTITIPAGWRSRNDISSVIYSDKAVAPEDGVLYLRRDISSLQVVGVGDVKIGSGKKSVPTNLSAHVYDYPVSTTIADLGLTEGGFVARNAGLGDSLYILSTSGTFQEFYYLEEEIVPIPGGSLVVPAGWRFSGDSSSVIYDDFSVEPGDAYVILRDPANGNLEVDRPQPF